MSEEKNNKLKKYPRTKMFWIDDTIGVPHSYCITSRHVVHASDNYCGILGEAAIESGEERGIVCHICKGDLSYSEHEQALLVTVNSHKELEKLSGLDEPLHRFLLECKPLCEADGFAGFAFRKNDGR